MDNWLIFQYRSMRVKTETDLLRKALRGLPIQSALGQRWSDVEG